MRRRRRSGGTWLPVLPTETAANTLVTYLDARALFPVGFLSTGTGLDNGPRVIPLTMDETPQAGVSSNNTLRDWVEGQEYVLKRVVGKVWAGSLQTAEINVERFIACFALAVLPVDDANPDVPAMPPEDYDPLLAQNTQQPWLWRRTWILSDNSASASAFQYPGSTAGYGSIADGGHLDTKGVSRRISKEQRIFIIFQANVLDQGPEQTDAAGVNWGYDLRLFGAMRRGKNRSTFK